MEVDRKAKPGFLGPYAIVRRTKGGAYIVAELDGSIYKTKIAAFRLIPYHPRQAIDIPITKLTELSTRELEEVEDEVETSMQEEEGIDDEVDQSHENTRPPELSTPPTLDL